jgi:hypothetical protein
VEFGRLTKSAAAVPSPLQLEIEQVFADAQEG